MLCIRRRVDRNQRELTKLFRKLGASVQVLSSLGKGCPDLLIAVSGYSVLVEIKDPEQSTFGQKLTIAEQSFFDSWKGEVYIIKTSDEAVKLVNNIRSRNACERVL